MSAVAATANPPKKKAEKAAKSEYMTWKAFQKEYLSREDEFKYEWTNGIVEKTPRAMNTNQLYIKLNLSDFVDKLRVEDPSIGSLYSEGDFLLTKQMHRRPDIAYLTKAQVKKAITEPVIIPDFVIEVISKTDNVNRVNRKVGEYFSTGVKVLWHIFPELKEVHIYEDAHGSIIRRGDETCSAEKVISGFVLTVNDIFKLP